MFRITRHGAAGSVDTTYEIIAIGKNTFKPYEVILAEQHATMPEHYSTICKEYDAAKLRELLSSSDSGTGATPTEAYVPIPREAAPVPIVSTNPVVPENVEIPYDSLSDMAVPADVEF